MAETAARAHLEQLGYRIVEMNWRCRSGELDLVARDGDTLCFVEVRARSRSDFGHPLETVDARKQERLRRTAMAYLNARGRSFRSMPMRFDVVSLIGEQIEVCRGAFE